MRYGALTRTVLALAMAAVALPASADLAVASGWPGAAVLIGVSACGGGGRSGSDGGGNSATFSATLVSVGSTGASSGVTVQSWAPALNGATVTVSE